MRAFEGLEVGCLDCAWKANLGEFFFDLGWELLG